MANLRPLTLTSLTLLTLATTACGHAALPTANMLAASAGHTLSVAGVTRNLGYDFKRYEAVFAPDAHKVTLSRQGILPATMDNRQFDAPIYDQGQLGSCTAFSMAKGMREYLQHKNGETLTPLSAMAFYYQERVDQNTVGQDSGATITEGMNTLKNWGVPPEADCPYDVANFTAKPSAQAFADAGANKVQTITQLSGVDDAKSAIASGHTVSIGFIVYESIKQATAPGSKGIIPVPKKNEQILGGHAVELVGYNDSTKLFTVRNSWGQNVGDHGYFYMPYAFVSGSTNGQANVDEIWTAD